MIAVLARLFARLWDQFFGAHPAYEPVTSIIELPAWEVSEFMYSPQGGNDLTTRDWINSPIEFATALEKMIFWTRGRCVRIHGIERDMGGQSYLVFVQDCIL